MPFNNDVGPSRITSNGRNARSFELFSRHDKKVAAERSVDRTEIRYVWTRWWDERGQSDKDSDTTFYRMENLQDGIFEILGEHGRELVVGQINNDVVAQYVARRRGQPVIRKRKDGSEFRRQRSNSDVNREVQLLRRILKRAKNVIQSAFLVSVVDLVTCDA